MNGSVIFRFVCIVLLWLILCYMLVAGRGLTAWTIWTILVSGVIVFVPLYKKYIRNGKKDQ